MWRQWRLVVRVEWLSRVGSGTGGPFCVDVVASQIRFLVLGGRPLVVGGVVGWSAWWVVLPSHALVRFVHGGLWPGGVGWWAVVVVVVVVVLVVVVGALVAVALVVVMVLRVCRQYPLAFRCGSGVGHRLQPLGPYGLVGSGGGLGAGLNGDRGQGVPRPRVGLARGGGGVWGVRDGALGDGNVNEGLDGVVLGGRLCGGGSRWREGGSGCGGCGVLAWVWVRVWVRAGLLLLPSYLLWFLGLCGVVLMMLLVVVVVLLLLRAMFSFGFRFWFWVGFCVGLRFEVEEGLVLEVRGHWRWVGGVHGVLLGCLGGLCGVRGASGSLACSCSFGSGRAFVDEVGGEGGGRRRRWRTSMRMRTRWKWWFWAMRVALPCERVRLCGLWRPPLRPLWRGLRAWSPAPGWGRVAGGAGEVRACGLRLPGSAVTSFCNA